MMAARRDRVSGRWRGVLVALSLGLLTVGLFEGLLQWWDVGDPPVFEADPRYGYLMQPRQTASTRGRRYRINHAGFRGAEFAPSRAPDVLRIAFVGDSITFGGGRISEDELFVNRIALALRSERWPRVEPVNMSVPGWGIQNMTGYIEAKGIQQADLVVWVVPSADFRRPMTSLEEHGFWQSKPWSRLQYLGGSLLWLGWRAWGNGHLRSAEASEATLDQNLVAFRRVLATLVGRGVPCIVAVLPDSRGYGHFAGDAVRYLGTALRAGARVFDLGPAFPPAQPGELFTDGVHLSGRGHEVVAGALIPFIQEALSTL